MSALITARILPQNFELIHDRIGEILTLELNNQFLFGYDPALDVEVYKDRTIPFSHTELPSVNVLMGEVNFMEQSQPNTQGMTKYVIECYTSAPHEDGDDVETGRGDTISRTKLTRLMGVIRSILEDPKYKTLGFAAPSIGRRYVERIYFMKTIHQDAESVMIGRVEFVVKAPESPIELITPVPIGGNDTTVNLSLTYEGFQWILNNP